MRNARKRRKRHSVAMQTIDLKRQLQDQKDACKDMHDQVLKYKSMAKTYWERWRFELHERKQLLIQDKQPPDNKNNIAIVNRSLLCDPLPSGVTDIYVGRGSFGIVKFQMYREIPVAVKEFLPLTNEKDVQREAGILQKLCHPYLPLFLGMCTAKKPYIVVMQYHGVNRKSVTLKDELAHRKLLEHNKAWLTICMQIVEALRYLHDTCEIIHNDLKANNILFCHKFEGKLASSTDTRSFDLQIVVIDFGKATDKEKGRMYHLSYYDMQKYHCRFPHMAPEVVDGKNRESTCSDIYAYGMLLKQVIGAIRDCLCATQLQDLADRCSSNQPTRRPSAANALESFELILKDSSL